MSNNYTIIGNDIEYGIPGAGVPWGIVTQDSSDPDIRVQEYDTGSEGSIGTVVIEDRKNTIKLDVLRASQSATAGSATALPMPSAGDIVTYDTIKYVVTGLGRVRKRGDAATLSVTLTKWTGVNLDTP